MCLVPGCGQPPGGGRFAASFTTLCDSHRLRDRRHGDPFQSPIKVPDIAPYVLSLKRRQTLHPKAAAWAALEARWRGLVAACEATLAVQAEGLPGTRWEPEAAAEVVKVATQASPEDAWRTAVAMFMLRAVEPTRFPTEKAFKVQLGRRVRHLADTNRGSYVQPDGRIVRVYRDPSPRAAVMVGDLLAETFGVAGIYFAAQDQADADAKLAERDAFYQALHEVAPDAAL